MSENFIPIVSTTPPPLDDFEDYDDDFTEFATAQNNWIDDGDDFTDCPLPEKNETLDSPIKSFIPNGEKFQGRDSEISFSLESKNHNNEHSEKSLPSFELPPAKKTYQLNETNLPVEPKLENHFQSMKIESYDETYSSKNHFNNIGQRPLFDEQDSNSINSSNVLQSAQNEVENGAIERPNFYELDGQSDTSDLSKDKSDMFSNETSNNDMENSESLSHSPTVANELDQAESKSINNGVHQVKLESHSSEGSNLEFSQSQTDLKNGEYFENKKQDSEHFSSSVLDSERPNNGEITDFSKEPRRGAHNMFAFETEESQPVEEISTSNNGSHFADFPSNSKPGDSLSQPSVELPTMKDTISQNDDDSSKFTAFAVTSTLETAELSNLELPPTQVTKSSEELPADFSDDEFSDFAAMSAVATRSSEVEIVDNNLNAESPADNFASFPQASTDVADDNFELPTMKDTISQNDDNSSKFTAFAVTSTLETAELSNLELPPTEVTKSSEELPADFSDDEFSDFAAMSAVVTRPSEVEIVDNDLNAESSADNFASFPQASTDAADDDFGAFNTQENNFGDFGTFDNFQSSSNPTNNDDFGDFSSVATESQVPKFEQHQPIQKSEPKPMDIKGWFPHDESTTDINSNLTKAIRCHVDDDLIQAFNSSPGEIHAAAGPSSTYRSSQLWDLLEDIDNAIALKHQWTNSSHHQHLLSALGINTQNILFGRTSKPYYVPTYYAAGLGLLEPGKEMKPLSAAEKITAMSPTDKNPPSIDGQSKPWTTETGVASNGLANGVLACSGVTGDSGSMPSNGVTLDASSLNLDAFSDSLKRNSQTTTSTTEQDKIDPELLELAMDVTPDLSTKRADPLSKILATLRVSSSSSSKKSPEEEEDLSAEAKKVLKKLPQISFMRSKVLMFPVGQSSPVHH